MLAFPADFGTGTGPFPTTAGGPVPANFVPPAALSGYNFTLLPAPSVLPYIPAGYYVLPVKAGLTAIVPADSPLLQSNTFALVTAALPGILSSLRGVSLGDWIAVKSAPPGALIVGLPASKTLDELSGAATLSLLADQAGLKAGTYGMEAVQDALSAAFPSVRFLPVYGNILATASA